MGDGSSPRSLSHAGIGRLVGCQLPDAILHGKRSLRPHSRAVQHLTIAGLLSEAFQLAWTGGCATSSRTRSRHVCVFLSASSPLSSGSAAALGRAFARCHGSRLLTLRLPFVSQVSGIVFNVADFSEGFHGSCLGHVSSPVRTLSLSRLSASFIWLTLFREPPEPPARADAQ
jgi:hypothetical protein